MRTQIYISVTVLILIQKSASEAVSLPSPANVSIQCDSYGVEVRWEYPDLDQDVYFQVKVKDSFSERSSNLTQNHHLNISSMLFNAAHNRYYVNVTAVRGGEKSNSTKSDNFSYNIYATANIKCYLDFPEVKLSPKDGKLHVQFTNPLQLYRNSPALRNLTDNLEYCIETDEGMNEVCETCQIKQNTSCETSVVFSEHRGEYRIILTGNIGQRFFNPRSSCFTGDIRSYPPVTVYVYPVLGVVLTLLFIIAVSMLLAKKCNSEMKKKVPSMFQHFFDFDETQSHPSKTLNVVPDNVESCLQIEPAEDTKEQTTLIPLSDTRDLGSGDSEDKSSYGPNDLVEDEQSDLSDFYDCPHAPRQKQEMSPGDTVDSYGPKLLLEV
ncbi:interferon gamma receptor 1 precursor [Sinocyclocheilus anshuiensis]|uniref:Interferon gamma receptor 1 n=1 Tax=Sinocyclocheilus anshuiensis TaxID=1608454 RepID=A0A671KXV7_9TELE|nr:interferon gamma receptor 1 precursor [Sinocyclocheilus anshuiensis]